MQISLKPLTPDFNYLLDTHTPVNANRMLPDWWKKMKRFHDPMMPEEAGNIKNCPAVRDILTQGIVIPAWTWIKFNQTKNGLVVTSGHDGRIEGWEATGHHTQNQIENTSVTELLIGGAIKLNCPWLIKTEENIQTMFFDPFYNEKDRPFRLLPGVVRTDVYHNINFPMEIYPRLDIGDMLIIEEGTPLITLLPVAVDKVKLNLKEQTSRDDWHTEGNRLLSYRSERYDQVVKNHDDML